MKETTPTARPHASTNGVVAREDDVFTHIAQKAGFRHYLGGLLGESERKKLTHQMSTTATVPSRLYTDWMVTFLKIVSSECADLGCSPSRV